MADLSVLLIEDDVRLATFTAEYLERHGIAVTQVTDGAAGLREALRRVHDAVVLDLMLPTIDGLAVCRELRAQSDVPILMATARIAESDRVLGLELGADDYLVKPFSPRELLARVKAAVRRARGLTVHRRADMPPSPEARRGLAPGFDHPHDTRGRLHDALGG